MENKNSFKILLFSKYSDSSKRLLGLIQENNLTGINLVCIDNEIVRKKIELSEMEINIVPCLLVVKDKNHVDKYEGNELNEWISLQQHHPNPLQHQLHQHQLQQHPHHQLQQHQLQQQHPQQQHQLQQQHPQQQLQQLQQQQHPQHQPQQQNNYNTIVTQQPQNSNKNEDNLIITEETSTTPINQLIEEENDDIEELSPITVEEISTKNKNKKKESKYKAQHDDYNEYETKNKKKEQKKLDLLNAAMLMKKSREDEDKSINKNFPNI